MTAQKGKLREDKMEQLISTISGTTNYDDIADVDLVTRQCLKTRLKKEIRETLTGLQAGAILQLTRPIRMSMRLLRRQAA